ncbi:MAG: AI-2E family transporter [Thiobacillus sp.]
MSNTEGKGDDRASSIAGSNTLLLAVALGLLMLLAWRLSDVLLLLFGGVIVAVALNAMAAPLERWLRLPQRAAVGVTVALTLIVITAGSWLVGDRLVEQTNDLRERLPAALAELGAWARNYRIGVTLQEVWSSASAEDVPWVSVANAATRTLGAIGSIGLLLVVGVYLAADPKLYRRGLVRLVPPAYRARIDGALLASGAALGRWLLGQGVSMLFVGSATAIGLALLGAPLALTVGLIAGVLAFVPFFGPIASGILAVLLAFTQSPTQALYVAGLAVAIQQVEGNLLMPWVQRWAVALPPVLGITAAVIFGLLFGLPGVILATPLMVVVMVLVQQLYVEGLLEAKEAGPEATRRSEPSTQP